MGLLINENEFTSKSTSPKLIGETFTTLRTGIIDGAVEQDGSQYNFSDFDSNLQSLFDEGKLPYLPIGKFDKMVTNQGGCDSFGYGTDTEWTSWEAAEGLYVYTNKASTKAEVGDPVYDAPGGNIIGNITRVDDSDRTTIYYDNTDGTSGFGYAYGTANGPVEPTPYFKVPKKLSRVLIRTQKPTADNDYTWYNLYSDGWVEQGGTATAVNAGSRFTLPIEMSDANYTIVGGKQGADTDGVGLNIEPATTTQFMAGVAYRTALTRQFSWQVSGYAASSEYTKDKWNYQNVQVERPMIQLFNSTTDTAVATCNQVLADVSALNQGDYVIETQLPTEENNYSWYRLYKSGWVEQGKFRNLMQSNANTTCMLIIPMKDTNYFVTGVYDTNTSAINSFSRIGVGAKTTQSFQMRTEGGQYSWEVKGFANITN